MKRTIRKCGVIPFNMYKIECDGITIKALLETCLFSKSKKYTFKIIHYDGKKVLDKFFIKGIEETKRYMDLNYYLLGGKDD